MEINTSKDLVHQGLPVTVRLQVWHYNERGRCPQFNHELASLFSPKDLGEWNYWTVHPAEVVEPPDVSIRDHYVPVEVDFVHSFATYSGPIGNPESGVRDIFNKFAPPIVYDYFVSIIQSLPHSMCIHALANGKPIANKNITMKYTHAFFFIPLELRLKRRFIKPSVIREDVIRDILEATDDSLHVLGALLMAYIAYQGGQIPNGIEALTRSKAILKDLSSKLPWLKPIHDNLNRADEEGSSNNQEPESTNGDNGSLALLNNTLDSFDGLRDLACGFETRLAKLASGESLTNQSIVTGISDLRQAILYLSTCEQTMQTINAEEIMKLTGQVSDHRTTAIKAGLATIGFAALTALALFNKPLARCLASVVVSGPLSGAAPDAVLATTAALGTAASGSSTVDHYRRMNNSLATLKDTEKAASDGRIALKGVFEALRQTQAALALNYMEQVMRLPMECMGDHERRYAFEMLGADLRFLGNDAYRDTLVRDRIQNLLETGRALQDAYQGTMDALHVATDTIGVVGQISD